MDETQQRTAQAIVNVFETGRAIGDYAMLAVLKGDSGHLSYGRSQASLGSGALYLLLASYCQNPRAQFAQALKPALQRFERRDTSLDDDVQVKRLLKEAGARDPIMRATQDQFFNRRYFTPALGAAVALGITEPLAQTVIYDTFIQGGWNKLKARVGPVENGDTRAWVRKYIALRTAWLKSLAPPLPSTVYRMSAFLELIEQKKWELQLPLTVRGVTITQDTFREADATQRTLRLTNPYLRGDDVQAVQKALKAHRYPASEDGVYGPFTHQLVVAFQYARSIGEAGLVGPLTRAALGV